MVDISFKPSYNVPMPDVTVNLAGAILVLIASIAFSYFTRIAWWSFAGISYLFYAKFNNWIVKLIFLIITAIILVIAILRMGWVM